MATVTIRYGGDDEGNPVAAVTTCFISCDDAPKNTDTGYDADAYPASPAVNYYFNATCAGRDELRSQVFSPDNGHGEWNDLIFPAAGSWTVGLYDVTDDNTPVDTLAVTVE